jgi:hypothetical protein
MKPGTKTANETADELENETTEPQTEGGDAADAFEDEMSNVVTDALNDDDETDEDEEDEDDLDLDEDDDLESGLDEDEEKEEGKGADAGKAADEKDEEEEKPAEGADADKPDASAEPKWEAFSIKADKETLAIEEAQITRAGGNVFIAIPEKQFARFQQRISRGALYERTGRQLESERKELEARKNAPPRKSDAEIEADITLAAIKEHLPDILDERDLALLEARVKLAQKEEGEKYAKLEKEHIEKANETPWEETQVRGLADTAIDIWQSFPELKDALTEEQVQEVFTADLLPVKDALFYRKDKDTLANTQYIYDRLKARATGKTPAGGKKPAAGSTKPATDKSAPNSAAKANPGKTATPAKGKTADAADRFNRGVDAAPRTTSVKANRTARPGKAATRDAGSKRRRHSDADENVRAEDNWRKTERNFLSSDSLEFDDDE